MITASQALAKYGPPEKEAAMVLWTVPQELTIFTIPKRIYCNRDLVEPLKEALFHLVQRGHILELKTWDGCFNIRKKHSGRTISLHSWALALDVNAAWNGYGKQPTLSKGFVECFIDSGFDWGGNWRTPDGMHFQLAKIK